jgi:hypothetical protein
VVIAIALGLVQVVPFLQHEGVLLAWSRTLYK